MLNNRRLRQRMITQARAGCLMVLMAFCASSARSQPPLDRVVGMWRPDWPLTINTLSAGFVGRLAETAGVPMGFEMAPGDPVYQGPRDIPATGKRLRDVLDAIVEADPRYEWREDDGVILIRPVGARNTTSVILDAQVGPITLTNANRDDAARVLMEIFGVPHGGPSVRNIKRFSLSLPEETPLLRFLNAVVRAHGSMAWALSIEKKFPGQPLYAPVSLALLGDNGGGFGILWNATIHPGPYVVRGTPPEVPQTLPALDRIVGQKRLDQPTRVSRVSAASLDGLARATGVPMGVQTSVREGTVPSRAFAELDLTGMPLKSALDRIRASDPRFEWRDMNGVIVFRPVSAWSDPADALSRPIRGLSIKNELLSVAIREALASVGRTGPAPPMNETDRVSIELPQNATVLELLNATARSHGALVWGWDDIDPAHTGPEWQGPLDYRHTMSFWFFAGGGSGFDVP